MNRTAPSGSPEASSQFVEEQWARLLSHDVGGVDRDIEALLIGLQRKHRYGRKKATALLVRRLSTFDDRRHDPL